MFKRIVWVSLALVVLISAVPLRVEARDTAWYEGIYLQEWNRRTVFAVEITATKLVDGAYRQSLVTIVYDHPITCYYPRFNETVLLYEDPDELSVSRDLGWGGLHGWAMVTNQCTGQPMRLDFNVDLFANARYVYDAASGTFTRAARLTGTISVDGVVNWDFSREPAGDYHEVAYSFSTRYPGR